MVDTLIPVLGIAAIEMIVAAVSELSHSHFASYNSKVETFYTFCKSLLYAYLFVLQVPLLRSNDLRRKNTTLGSHSFSSGRHNVSVSQSAAVSVDQG